LIGVLVVYAAAVGYFALVRQKELGAAVMVAFPAMIASFVPVFARLNGIQKELEKRSGQE
jgi:biotin transporter BioY